MHPVGKNVAKPAVCPFALENSSVVEGLVSGYKHAILTPVNCSTENCIYYWRCTKGNCSDYPHCEYIGMTSRSFKKGFSEHRDYPKRNVTTEPSGQHFTQPGHSVADLKGQVLEKQRPICSEGQGSPPDTKV